MPQLLMRATLHEAIVSEDVAYIGELNQNITQQVDMQATLEKKGAPEVKGMADPMADMAIVENSHAGQVLIGNYRTLVGML